jgi:uncharacterized membrane protein YfcA
MIELQLISVLLGLVVGFILALTGAGGSIMAIPLLVFGLNLSLTQAAPIALLAVMSAASVGAVQGLHIGIVRYKTALLIASFGIVLAPLGVWLARRSPILVLNLIFAALLTFVAWRMWQQSTQTLETDENKPAPACVINPATSKLFWTALCTRRLIITGGMAGLLSGLLGVGGGFAIVPSLRKVSNFDMQTIIATSLTAIALVSAASIFTFLLHGDINWQIAVPFVTSAIIGMFAFRLISQKIPAKISQRSFAVLSVVAAVIMIIKSVN